MSRTNIDIDDELIAECMKRYSLPTKRSAVEFALRRLLTRADSVALFEDLVGTGWGGDLEQSRTDNVVPAW